jgi:hypothetical protein
MSEGLSAVDVAPELARHAEEHRHARHDKLLSVAEAIVLSVVTLVAAWSGYAAAKWSTESRLQLAEAASVRSDASRAFQQALTLRAGDATTFNSWFAASLVGDPKSLAVAERRFRPEYRPAFEAWLATHPFTNPEAPPGPQSMPQYHPTGEAESRSLDASAQAKYAEGQHAGEVADDYVRTTVVLASVLFLVGISSHFSIRPVRVGVLVLASVLLLAAAIAIVRLPVP